MVIYLAAQVQGGAMSAIQSWRCRVLVKEFDLFPDAPVSQVSLLSSGDLLRSESIRRRARSREERNERAIRDRRNVSVRHALQSFRLGLERRFRWRGLFTVDSFQHLRQETPAHVESLLQPPRHGTPKETAKQLLHFYDGHWFIPD
jgi:hypothetical protein